MATQGLISIIKDGRVVIKCVAGCNGQFAPEAAEHLRNVTPTNIQDVYRICLGHKFGCEHCLIVMDATNHMFEREQWESVNELSELYQETFDDPDFNPRWARGTAEYTEKVII